MDREAVLLVRNDAAHDARVLRAARTLAGLGLRPLVVAVRSDVPRPAVEERGSVRIVRLVPLERLRARRARASAAAPVATAPTAAPAPRAGLIRRARRTAVALDYYRRAAGIVRARRPALVVCNDLNTLWVGAAARLLAPRAAVVYDAHELWPDRNLRPEPRAWLLAVEAALVRLAHARVTASPGYARAMARRYRIAAPTVVRNVPEEAALAASPPAASGPPVAVYVGGLLRNRGLEQAIAATALIPSLRLRLVGPAGPGYAAELRALAAEHGVAERVELAAPVAPEDVVGALAGAHIGLSLIQPACLSYELTLPNKLLEYVAAGVPVLASDLEVMAAFVREHGVGMVTAPDDTAAIARDLRRLLEPPVQEACRAAAGRARRSLTWECERTVLENVYLRALGVAA